MRVRLWVFIAGNETHVGFGDRNRSRIYMSSIVQVLVPVSQDWFKRLKGLFIDVPMVHVV